MYPISSAVKALFDAEHRQVLRMTYADNNTESATGELVTVNDAAGVDAEALSVAIEPMQDLHGYDSPWPAGGGKNLYDANAINALSSNGITATVNNGAITFNGTATATAYFDVYPIGLASGQYAFSFNNPVASSDVHVSFRSTSGLYFSDTGASEVNKSVAISGEPNTVILYIRNGTTLTNFVIRPQLESGSTPTAWTPYSNICPISGWDGTKVTRMGKNLLPLQNISGSMSGVVVSSDADVVTLNGTASAYGQVLSNSTFTLNAGTYYLKVFTVSGRGSCMYQLRSVDGLTTYANTYTGIAFTLEAQTTVKARVAYPSGSTFYNLKIRAMVVSGDVEPASYEPYQGETYDIVFPSEAGTVYGGTLDVTTGLLTVDRKFITLNGTENFIARSVSGSFYCVVPDALQLNATSQLSVNGILSSYYKSASWGSSQSDNKCVSCFYYGGIHIKDTSYSSVEQLKTALSSNPLQVVYPLNVTQTYQLTPTQIALLAGENNVWADAGDVTVQYHPIATITDADVLMDGFGIDHYCCNGEKLEVGTAIAGQMTLKLNNTDGKFSDVVFEGSEMFAEVGIADWTQNEPTITYIPCGYFTPDMQPRQLNHVDLTCLDRMTRFDVVVEPTDLTLPATVAGLVGQMNALCGVTLAESIDTLPNADVVITELPTVTGDMTYRNLLQWCAGIMATNAWFDWNGLLRLTWYGATTNYETTTENRYNSDYYEDDLTITGAVYTNSSGVEIVEGTDDYAIDLTGNALAGPLIATVLPAVNTAVNGFSYRPFTAAVVNAPYLWPMDAIDFTDKDGNTYSSVLTNVAFGLNGTTALESKGLTYAINQRAQPNGVTKEQAQLLSEVAKTVEDNIDASLTPEDIFNRLTDNGKALGLFRTQDGQLYINASYIYSGLLTLGGLNNQNGALRVLDASGNVICTINNTGVDITDGSVTTYSPDRLLRTILSNGEVSVQYWGQDSGTGQYRWKDMLAVTADSDGSMVKASTGALTLRGKDAVHLTNRNGTTDTEYATADMEDASVVLRAYSAPGGVYEGDSTLEMGPDGVKMSVGDGDDTKDDPAVELSKTALDASAPRVNITATEGAVNISATYTDLSGDEHTGTATYNGTTLNVEGALNASDPARTRTNLGITPANIGALPLSGGRMTGDIDMGQSTPTSGAKRLLWETADGVRFYIRPYNDVFQIVRQDSNGSYNALGFKSDGSVTMDTPVNWRNALGVYSKAESDALVRTRMWSVRGNIVRSISGTAVGYGKAMVYIVGKTVVVEFEAKITTAGTVSNLFDVGIEVAVLRSLNTGIPEFTVVNGGIIHYYNSDGTIDTSMEGYAGEATLNTAENRWAFARLYDTNGSIGPWADNRYTVGKIITGTVYGTL